MAGAGGAGEPPRRGPREGSAAGSRDRRSGAGSASESHGRQLDAGPGSASSSAGVGSGRSSADTEGDRSTGRTPRDDGGPQAAGTARAVRAFLRANPQVFVLLVVCLVLGIGTFVAVLIGLVTAGSDQTTGEPSGAILGTLSLARSLVL
jgi:hypothetical protein